MAQVPATPKLRRALLQATAALAGAGAARRLAVAPSEVMALERRAQRRAAPEDPTVVFLVPLVGRHHVGDWAAVERHLTATLESFRRQTDGQWLCLLCGQDRPALPDDARMRFLPFTEQVEGNDKWAKLARLCAALPGLGVTQGYAMTFDADDLLGPGAVAEMRRRRVQGGYLVERGYVADVGAGRIGLAGPPTWALPLRKPLWKLCGSTAAFGFNLRQEPGDAAFLAAVTAHEHRMFPYLARLAGRPLAPLADPAVLYVLNHGENFGARRGRVAFKARFVERFEVTDPAERERISEAFPGF